MKKAFKPALFVLLMCGVFGADEDEVKSVFVMEGDSVTLNPDQTQIQGYLAIEWRFEDQLIAFIDGSKTKYPYERFGDRLKLNQTGSLTITNMKTKHSGLYHLQIELNTGTVNVDFAVTVYESPSVIDAGESEMKSVSVKEGDRVTLQTGVTPLSGDELIVWRCGEGKLIAKADKEDKSSHLYDTDGRFRGRLELDQTGSLIITNTNTTDSGFYTVKISSSRTQTVYKRFSVSVIVTVTVSEPGLSSGAVAGIVLLFLAAAVAAAAVVGFICHRRKISELRKQILTVTVTRTEGDDITLKPNNTIQKGDGILWMFGEEEQRTSIAKLIGETGEIVTRDYAADKRFRGRLDLDKTTGSLTIRNSRTTHSGLYTLYITSSSGDSQQRFIVTVKENEEISVDEGGSVTLKPDTEIQRDDQILWIFEDLNNIIAKIREETGEIYIYDDDDVLDGRFRGRLKLEKKTGSLIITDIKPEHTGLYELYIISRGILCKRFRVYIPWRDMFVTEGESVHLSTGRPKIKRDDEIQWRCGGEIIAEVKGGTGETHDGADGRFRDRLQLNVQTGDLTIKNSTDEDDGDYKLKIRSRKGNTNRAYRVIIRVRKESPVKGNNGKRVDESAVEIPLLDK